MFLIRVISFDNIPVEHVFDVIFDQPCTGTLKIWNMIIFKDQEKERVKFCKVWL